MYSYIIKTLELYNQLPQNKSERMNRHDIRDKIIELNYSLFHYIAAHTYIKNVSVDYEDKLQCGLYHFCRIWWMYKWDGTGGNGRSYRDDLSFATFFKPRISSLIRNDLQEISYTTRRTTLIKIGNILNKKWTEVTLEDLDKVTISTIDMNIARMVLDPNYRVSFDYEMLFYAQQTQNTSYTIPNPEEYNGIEEMLIHETIEKEDRLTNKELKHLAEILELNYKELIEIYPKALDILTQRLKDSIEEHYENEEWWM